MRSDRQQLALEFRAERAAHVRARIVDVLATAAGGLTFEGVAHATGLNPNTVRGRLSELEREGVVYRRNARRRTESGRRAAVYVVTPPRPVAAPEQGGGIIGAAFDLADAVTGGVVVATLRAALGARS